MAIQQGGTDTWTKSSYSTGNGACVEIKSPAVHAVSVRDSKVTGGELLGFAPATWTSFVSEVARGAFDRD
ncbi:DUF397 domain-containing protein [Streptomyces sp. NPDC058045]|uniref:DUF397 domain-containing protein n=1 Tax=Streptomyces sp. NPDC058045 TaxID=3346311 RepID=UPI0036E0B081